MDIPNCVETFHRQGFVIFDGAIDPAHVILLRDIMLHDVQKILARTHTPYNFNKGNIQQAPPPFHPYLFEDILFNDRIIDIAEGIFGSAVTNGFYSGNTALSGDHTQPVHPDTSHPVAGATFTPTFAIVVNIPLVDMSVANGATELWPGTHKDTTYGGQTDGIVQPKDLDRWRSISPPYQPDVPAGTIIMRDMRLWHAGKPNHTANPRPMIAMILRPVGTAVAEEVEIPARSAAFFTHRRIETILKVIPDAAFNHLMHGESYGV